jgi:malate permease and related proteins
MFQSITTTLVGVILPLSIPVLCGVILTRWKNLETKHLLTIVLYVLSPGMIFHNLITAQITLDDVTRTGIFILTNIAVLWAIAKSASTAFKLPATETAGLTLIATLTNAVNYGLPLVYLAFGQLGMEKASIYVVMQMILVNTLGVYFAARSRFSGKAALRSVFSLPAIYAAAAAITLRMSGILVPPGIAKGVGMLAQAYSPMVLLILGAQMASVKTEALDGTAHKAFWTGMTIRMLLSPLVATVILNMLGVTGLLRAVLIIEASMPVAVNAVILAEKFEAAPKLVTRCILWTTLASFIALPILLGVV